MSVVSTSLNIGQQSSRRFPEYTRSIVHMHKWDITPPERIYVDMRCRGIAQSPAQGRSYLIVYGVMGRQNDVSPDVYDSVYVVEKGKMVVQTDLSLNSHHIRGVSVDENDKTSAVSLAYLEGGGAEKIRDKAYHDLFISFIDFRLPDTYGLVKIGNDYYLNAKVEKAGAADPNENQFRFFAYEGKRGLRLTTSLSVRYPSAQPLGTQFVFVGYFSDNMFFRFSQASRIITITVASPYLKVQDSDRPSNESEKSRVLANFLNKKVIFTVSFERLRVLCELMNIDEKRSHRFNFTPQNFRLTTVSFSPPNQGSFMFEFFGLNKGDDDDLLQKFFLQEINRN